MKYITITSKKKEDNNLKLLTDLFDEQNRELQSILDNPEKLLELIPTKYTLIKGWCKRNFDDDISNINSKATFKSLYIAIFKKKSKELVDKILGDSKTSLINDILEIIILIYNLDRDKLRQAWKELSN